MPVLNLEIVKGYNSHVINILKELLERAKDGEIVEVACITKLAGGAYESNFSGCENLHELVGQLERLKLFTLRRMDT